MTKSISSYSINKQSIPNYLIKELNISKTSDDLKHNLLKDGYLFIRNIYNKEDIKSAKDSILKQLHEVGEVKNPYSEGIFSGVSLRRKIYPTKFELGKFWQKISESN